MHLINLLSSLYFYRTAFSSKYGAWAFGFLLLVWIRIGIRIARIPIINSYFASVNTCMSTKSVVSNVPFNHFCVACRTNSNRFFGFEECLINLKTPLAVSYLYALGRRKNESSDSFSYAFLPTAYLFFVSCWFQWISACLCNDLTFWATHMKG